MIELSTLNYNKTRTKTCIDVQQKGNLWKRERGRGQTGREKGNDTKSVTQKALPKVNHGIEGFAGRIKKIMLSLKYPDTLTRQSPIQQTLFPILLNC